jgi:signal recognition particle receptor subunit beta
MGGCLSSIDSSSTRVSFIGLQGSGKSSLIAAASAKVVAVPTPVATPLPSVEPTLSISQTHCSIGADSSAVVLIDAPSDPSLNAQLSSDILVFVVDAADFQRYQSARAELDRILRTRGNCH